LHQSFQERTARSALVNAKPNTTVMCEVQVISIRAPVSSRENWRDLQSLTKAGQPRCLKKIVIGD
jgi:hypothetical protein